jgi:ABC-type branched-subunit amino acid transport system substrate-binding protein
VVPNPLDKSFQAVSNYQSALTRHFPGSNFTYAGLEGYLGGRFFIELVGRIRGNITAASIINAAYQGQYFTVDDLLFGPFGDTTQFNCSQGSHDVYFMQLMPSKTTQELLDARFSWPREQCSSTSDNVVRPIFFGQSAALTGPSKQLGIPYRTGLVAAFERFNRLGGLDGRPVRLLSLDDGYEPDRSTENTKTLLAYQPMGLIGWSGTAVAQAAILQSIPARVPFFCPFSGAVENLRDPCSKYVVHNRVSY